MEENTVKIKNKLRFTLSNEIKILATERLRNIERITSELKTLFNSTYNKT